MGELLDASLEVGHETDPLMAAVVTWVTHCGEEHRAERTNKSLSVPDIIRTTFEEDVQPSLVRTAA
jgi:hypothetical protein